MYIVGELILFSNYWRCLLSTINYQLIKALCPDGEVHFINSLLPSDIKSGYTVIAKLLYLNTDFLLNTNLKIHAIQIISFS